MKWVTRQQLIAYLELVKSYYNFPPVAIWFFSVEEIIIKHSGVYNNELYHYHYVQNF